MKREAVLDCFAAARAAYKHAWARTSVDLAIEVSLQTWQVLSFLCQQPAPRALMSKKHCSGPYQGTALRYCLCGSLPILGPYRSREGCK